jgi:IS605 OrfB family transposase
MPPKKKVQTRAQIRRAYVNKYKRIIKDHTNDIWIPPLDKQFDNIFDDSWFDISKINSDFPQNKGPVLTEKTDKTHYTSAFKIILDLDHYQDNILKTWMDCYTKMYNETLKFIKEERTRVGKLKLDFIKLRTHYLKGKKDNIIKKCASKYGVKIFAHIIDTAIKLACSNYKSAVTNYKRGNIRHFRIRYWKYGRLNRTLEIEPSLFKSAIPKMLGKIKAHKDGVSFNLDDIHKIHKMGVKLRYEGNLNQWTIWIPEKKNIENMDNSHKYAVLDPGIRRFMTGMSEDEMFFIGQDCTKIIKNYLKRKECAKKIPNDRKRMEKTKLYERKITNMVDDLHWKSIKYLTDNYNNILIGDMSVKGIVASNRSTLDGLTKVAALRLKFYKYRQRLEYKCLSKGLTYKLMDEKYTSKLCSNCGWENITLGGADKFHCKDCGINIYRDANGCRGIYLKQWFK